MMTVSAVAKLIPKPPARVDNKNTNCGAPGAEKHKISICNFPGIPFVS